MVCVCVYRFNWSIIALQCCGSFCSITKCMSCKYTYIPSLLRPSASWSSLLPSSTPLPLRLIPSLPHTPKPYPLHPAHPSRASESTERASRASQKLPTSWLLYTWEVILYLTAQISYSKFLVTRWVQKWSNTHVLGAVFSPSASGQTTGREHSLTYQEKTGSKIYWAWPRSPEKDPVFLIASPSHQEACTSLSSSFMRRQTEWKTQSQKTNQTDPMDYDLA